jgi:DNA-binding beta-propeller fold protein YncE
MVMKIRPKRVVVLALAFLLAACSAEVATPRPSERPTETPSPTASPRPTNAANDVIYLRSVASGGVANILAIDARTGATLRSLPDGSPSFDRATLFATEDANGSTQTIVRRLDIGSGRELGLFTLDRTYHAIWTEGGQTALSRDGHRLVLSISPYQQSGDWVTGFRVVDAGSGATEATLDLKGKSTYGFVAISSDGRSLYLNQFGEGAAGLRVFDVPSSTLLPATAVAGAVSQSGFRAAAAFSPDGRWMFSLDAGSPTSYCASWDGPRCTPKADEQPYFIALDLVSRRFLTVPLPMEQRSTDFEKYLLWSVAVAPDGATAYAINPALGVIDEIDTRQLTMRRTSSITVSRADQGLLAAVGRFFFPVADAKRYITSGALLSPSGDRIYAAGSKGIAVVNTSDLSSRAAWQAEAEFDALALTADGERLYAVSNANGKIAIIATRDGSKLGELKIPAFGQTIIRIDSSR